MTLAERLIAKGELKGKLEGKREGKKEGKREGKLEGKLEGKQESLLKQLVQKFGDVSEADKVKIKETQDPDRLDQSLILLLKSNSIEEILRPLDR